MVTRNRCLEALGRELAIVPENIKQEYLLMRRDFFRSLITYCKSSPENYTQNDLNEFGHSLSILEDLVK